MKDARVEAIMAKLQAAQSGLKKLLFTSKQSTDFDNVFASPALWNFKIPLTFPALQNTLHSKVKVSAFDVIQALMLLVNEI